MHNPPRSNPNFQKLKRFLRYVFTTIVAFVGFILLYLGVAYCLSRITVNGDTKQGGDVAIFIKTNGVHTDIVVPVSNSQMDWSRDVKFANTAANDTTMRWLAMGWGDKGFYLQTPEWKDLTCKVAFNAAFGLGTTAIHATFYKQLAESKSCKQIMISQEDYAKLIAYIQESFKRDERGNVEYISTTANYGKADAFYEARGRYSMFRTCNSWANGALKASGQKACLWTAFDTGIFLKYED